MKLIHLVSEAQELYRKESHREIRKWRSRKRKGLEIKKICGVGEDYHLASRYNRLAYDNIASSVIKIKRMELEILNMYAIIEMLYLSGKVKNKYTLGLKSIHIGLDVKDTALRGSAPDEGKPYPSAYITIEPKFGEDLIRLKIDRNVRLNVSIEIEAGVSPKRIARALVEALEDYPKFREHFIEETTKILNKAK